LSGSGGPACSGGWDRIKKTASPKKRDRQEFGKAVTQKSTPLPEKRAFQGGRLQALSCNKDEAGLPFVGVVKSVLTDVLGGKKREGLFRQKRHAQEKRKVHLKEKRRRRKDILK